MSDSDNKTEKPTGKKMGEAASKGQFARTAEIQTVFALTAGFLAVTQTSESTFRVLTTSFVETLGHLGSYTITADSIHQHFAMFLNWLAICVLPVMLVCVVAGILSGGLQSRFQVSLERLEMNLERLNPIPNLMSLFQPSPASLMKVVVGLLKLLVILGFTYLVIKQLLGHPIFYTATNFGDIVAFMVESVKSVTVRVIFGLTFIAAADYGFQLWKHNKDLMMTKEEVKDESKNAEGNPAVKSEMRKRRLALLRGNWAKEIPTADVVITNPTHLAVVLRYNRKTMRAPKLVAKGARLNALRIRELAQQFQIPIVENKPIARMLFKHCKVGQEVPPQVYAAVAEVLAYVYRVNRYRYYVEGQQVPS